MYINEMNILTDLELMFNTFRIMFSKESTEGFDSQISWLNDQAAGEAAKSPEQE